MRDGLDFTLVVLCIAILLVIPITVWSINVFDNTSKQTCYTIPNGVTVVGVSGNEHHPYSTVLERDNVLYIVPTSQLNVVDCPPNTFGDE